MASFIQFWEICFIRTFDAFNMIYLITFRMTLIHYVSLALVVRSSYMLLMYQKVWVALISEVWSIFSVSHILDDFCDAVEATHFYGCLWECVVTCSNIRLSAISYVLAHYKRKLTMEDQLYIIGTNIDTMVDMTGSWY